MMLRLAKGLVTAATVVYSIPLVGWLLFRVWKGESWPMVGMLNAVGIWWFAPLLLLLPLALIVRARQAILMSGLILLVALALFGSDFTPRVTLANQEGARLRVLTFNVLVSNMAFDAVIETIRAAQPDVVAIQELSPEMAAAISAAISDTHPYQLLAPWGDPRGIGLWSRYPLGEGPSLSRALWENWAQAAVVDVGGRPLYLFNVHLWPIGTLDREQFARALVLQHAQAEELAALVATLDVPVLVIGDFNASPTNDSYATLNRTLDDAWREVGVGPGFTFPDPNAPSWGFPFLRIDYMWTRGAIHPATIQVLPGDTGSDHLPLLGEFVVGE